MLALFLAEGRDLLDRVDAELLLLETTPDARRALDSVFRALHSLKGMSATVALDATAQALHAGESLLAAARDTGRIEAPQLSALLTLSDAVRLALDAADAGQREPSTLRAVAAQLDAMVGGAAQRPDAARDRALAAARVQQATAVVDAHWRLDVTLADDCAIPLARATVIRRRLAMLADVLAVAPDDAMQADSAWNRMLTLWLGSARDGSALDAASLESAARACGDVAECAAVRTISARPEVQPAQAPRTVRIPAQRLDDLLDLIGELVLARDRMVRTHAGDEGPARVAIDDTARLILQLRDGILHSRLVPLAEVFDRFPRHVRDTALTLGKDVELVVEGRELEVDRSLLDELGDPLLHLLRNALDHGIEPPADRLASGKPRRGRIVVRATRDAGMLAVTVADDGRGVDRDSVAATALAQGVTDAAGLARDDQGLLQLLARPGLSTATAVTTLSGRGVGVDAVLHRVQALGGRLELATASGTGTAITVRLPLSVAMLRALLVRVADERYAIPLALIHRTVIADDLRGGASAGSADIEVGGTRLPLVSLRQHLGLPPADDVSGHLVVLEGATGRVALLVDACLAQHEIVVKPLQRVRGAAPKFSGGTILPDGTPSLILDINSLT